VSDASQISFREAVPADESALIRMMRQLAEQEPGALVFHESIVRGALRKFLANSELGRVWLILEQQKSAGYVVLTLGFSFEYHGREAFIDELYIEPECRRKGLGRQAMKFVAGRAREMGVHAIHLEVDHGNEPALELYRRESYEDHGRYLMTKWLVKRDI
jgi:ribosomal protein S18 acetylase RimI-like enzyme